MQRLRNARGSITLRGPTWWLTRPVLVVDPETGETRRQRRRERLGPKTELRSRAAARARADAWLAQLAPEQLVPGPRVLAADYFEHYLAVHAALLRPTSRKKYRAIIRTHLVPAFGSIAVAEIDTVQCRALIARLAVRYRRWTIKSIRGVLLQVLRQAVRDGFGARRIEARDVRLPKSAEVEPERRHITPAELDAILAAATFPRRALWALMGFAGLRIGEALGVAWKHVDLDRQILCVRQASVDGEIAALKTGSSRADLPILKPLAEILAAYRDVWTANPAGLLFTTRRGTPIAPDYARRHWLKPLLATLDLRPAGCHAFRHGLPGRLAARGVSPAVIQKIMRHASIAMTERYLHTGVEDIWNSLNAAGIGKQNAAPLGQTAPRQAPQPALQGGP